MSRRRLQRAVLAAVVGLAVLALLVVAGLVAIAGTPRGSAWAVRSALDAAGPGFTVGRIEGRLADTLSLDDLRIEQDGLLVTIGRLEFAWRPARLWRGELRVIRLMAREVRVVPPASADDGTPAGAPTYPPLPLAIVVESAVVEQLEVVQGDAGTVIERIALGARADAERADLENLAVVAEAFEVRGEAGVAAGDVLAVSATLAATLPQQAPPVELTLGLAGRLDALHVEVSVAGPAQARLAGDVDALATPPAFDLAGRVEPYTLDAANGDRVGPTILKLAGTPRAITAEVEAPAALAALGQRQLSLQAAARSDDGAAWAGRLDWSAHGADDAPWPALAGGATFAYGDDTVTVEHRGSAPFDSVLEARVTALGATPQLALDLRIEHADVPPGAPAVHLDRATVRARGALDALALTLDAAGELPQRGPLALQAQARLDGDQLALEKLQGDVFGGSLEASGTVVLGAAPGARLDLQARGLDLAQADARLAGRLGFAGALDARVVDGEPAGSLVLSGIEGDWRGYELAAQVEVTRRDGVIEIRGLDAAVGDNRVRADARVGAALDGGFAIAAHDLGQFAEGLGGTLDGQGRLGGSLDAPRVEVDLRGQGLRYGDFRAAALELDAALDLATDEAQHVTVSLAGLAQGRENFGDLALTLDGTPDAHRLHGGLDGGPRTLELEARGAWADDAWNGTVDTLALGLGSFGAWSLAAPSALSVRADGVSLERACLVSGEARLCATVPGWAASAGSAAVELEAIPLDLLADYLPTTVAIAGALGGQADIERSEGRDRATAALAVTAGEVRLSLEDGTVETVPIPSLTADLVLGEERLDVVTAGAVGDWVNLDGALGYVFADGGALDARLALVAERLDWLEEFVPDLAGSRGRARLEATASGSAEAPLVDARVQLEDGALRLQATGMQLSRLDLGIHSGDGRRYTLDGALGNDDGMLELDGELERTDGADWRARLAARGEHVGAVRLPDVEADVSPDLELRYADGYADIRGSITLPRVHVTVRHLPPAAVEVSGDEVLVGDGAADPEPAPNFFVDAFTGDVEVNIGDDVWISAAGLEARLGGGLRWTKARGDGIGRGEGRVSIVEGGYEAYGQALSIERGHLTFAGPIDNPSLDVRAVRPDLDIVAGLLVSGDVRAPRFDLFSEPPLPDAEVLSYVITGEGLSEASSGEGKLIARAALSLGAERSSMVTSQVADAFGLDELSVNTGDTARETSFTAGKRIGPKLAVRSEFNPFDRLWSFFLNYKLTSHWAVEAESGVRQGADVIYSIEREELLPDNLLEPGSWFGDD